MDGKPSALDRHGDAEVPRTDEVSHERSALLDRSAVRTHRQAIDRRSCGQPHAELLATSTGGDRGMSEHAVTRGRTTFQPSGVEFDRGIG
jgi:hypothetical protein